MNYYWILIECGKLRFDIVKHMEDNRSLQLQLFRTDKIINDPVWLEPKRKLCVFDKWTSRLEKFIPLLLHPLFSFSVFTTRNAWKNDENELCLLNCIVTRRDWDQQPYLPPCCNYSDDDNFQTRRRSQALIWNLLWPNCRLKCIAVIQSIITYFIAKKIPKILIIHTIT